MPILSSNEWEAFLKGYPDAHLLQTPAWGELKRSFGWRPLYIADRRESRAGAQVLFREIPLGFSMAYIPKGPVGDPDAWEQLWGEIDAACRGQKSVFLKVEPDCWQENGAKPPSGFQRSPQSVQPSRTLVVDLTGTEDHVLGRMKQKTRYNIRLALKKGVVVGMSSDLEVFYRLMQVTAGRDAFGVHSQEYYRRAYELFHPKGEGEILVAELKGTPLAALMVFAHGKRAWYFYGASSNEYRDHMPTYLLQWEAMRWARAHGCAQYDLWGVPDVDEDTLEAEFSKRKGGLWGVYRFKRGFGGQLRRAAGPWDRVYRPWLYAFYRWWAGRQMGE
jgi:lipid II:glycine glycyltransferase (peptidoglycan interpeptide bridge formation enzyme)